jgi:hypothetical protein
MDQEDIEYTAEGEYSPLLWSLSTWQIRTSKAPAEDWLAHSSARCLGLRATICGQGMYPPFILPNKFLSNLVWSRCRRYIWSSRWPTPRWPGVLLVCFCIAPRLNPQMNNPLIKARTDILFWIPDRVFLLWSRLAIFPCWEVYGDGSIYLGWCVARVYWRHELCFIDGVEIHSWVYIPYSFNCKPEPNEF